MVFAIATIILQKAVHMLTIVKGYAGLCKTAPPKRDNATVHDCEKTPGSGKPENLARSPAERSGGGFAGSPDVPASGLGPRIVYSLYASYGVECETSGLGGKT
jgi:hypothetical protein